MYRLAAWMGGETWSIRRWALHHRSDKSLQEDAKPSQRNYLNRPTFPLMTILPRKGLLALAVVVDVALQTDGPPISAETLATRHGLPSRHLESVLQSLVREGILKGIRGPHGGYELARERSGITANDILRAARNSDRR